jgi:hypothetical protein
MSIWKQAVEEAKREVLAEFCLKLIEKRANGRAEGHSTVIPWLDKKGRFVEVVISIQKGGTMAKKKIAKKKAKK